MKKLLFTLIITITILAKTNANICEDTFDDNASIRREDRSALASIDYYQFIPYFNEIGHELNLQPVKVGIIDSGLNLTSGEFNYIQNRITNVMEPGRPVRDFDLQGHGTKVTSVIAADQNGRGMNGLASRILGPRLQLVIGRNHQTDPEATLNQIRAAIQAGAQIINLSFGYSFNAPRPIGTSRVRQLWTNFFNEPSSRNVLFIAAAPNHPWSLTHSNDAPAGMQFDNLITVGGYDSLNPMNHEPRFATGIGIEIAAPANYIPTTSISGTSITHWGNSYSAAYVTAIAAILKSIRPSTSAQALKRHILHPHSTLPTSTDISGKRVSLFKTVGRFILLNSGSIRARELLNHYASSTGNGHIDPPGLIVNRVCGSSGMGIDYTLTNHRGINLNGTNVIDGANWITQQNSGSFAHGRLAINTHIGNYDIAFSNMAQFLIQRPYLIDSEAVALLQYPNHQGHAPSGILQITGCELTTRSMPLNWTNTTGELITFIQLQGNLSATFRIINLQDLDAPPVDWSGSIRFNMPISITNITDEQQEHLESNCHGGYSFGPP